jgi:hypothetical protein
MMVTQKKNRFCSPKILIMLLDFRAALPRGFLVCDPLCPLWLRVAFFAGFRRMGVGKKVVRDAKITPKTKGLERPNVQISKAPNLGSDSPATHVNPA